MLKLKLIAQFLTETSAKVKELQSDYSDIYVLVPDSLLCDLLHLCSESPNHHIPPFLTKVFKIKTCI